MIGSFLDQNVFLQIIRPHFLLSFNCWELGSIIRSNQWTLTGYVSSWIFAGRKSLDFRSNSMLNTMNQTQLLLMIRSEFEKSQYFDNMHRIDNLLHNATVKFGKT